MRDGSSFAHRAIIGALILCSACASPTPPLFGESINCEEPADGEPGVSRFCLGFSHDVPDDGALPTLNVRGVVSAPRATPRFNLIRCAAAEQPANVLEIDVGWGEIYWLGVSGNRVPALDLEAGENVTLIVKSNRTALFNAAIAISLSDDDGVVFASDSDAELLDVVERGSVTVSRGQDIGDPRDDNCGSAVDTAVRVFRGDAVEIAPGACSAVPGTPPLQVMNDESFRFTTQPCPDASDGFRWHAWR